MSNEGRPPLTTVGHGEHSSSVDQGNKNELVYNVNATRSLNKLSLYRYSCSLLANPPHRLYFPSFLRKALVLLRSFLYLCFLILILLLRKTLVMCITLVSSIKGSTMLFSWSCPSICSKNFCTACSASGADMDTDESDDPVGGVNGRRVEK